MNRKRVFGVSIVLIAIACLGVESASIAQAARTKPKTKAASSTPSNGKPTVVDAKTVIEKHISGGRFKVTSITKTNGAEFPMQNQYQLFYTLRVECLVSEGQPKYFGPMIVDYGTTRAIACENVGDVSTGTGTLYFYKTERGWKSVASYSFPGWFERIKGGNDSPFMPGDKKVIVGPSSKWGTGDPAPSTAPVPIEYDKFLGVWSYTELDGYSTSKRYFRITKDQQGRFQFDEGWNDDANVVSKITWSRDVLILTNADGIFLKPSKGNLHAKFVSANFRATHGHDFSYQITLQIQPNGKLLYSLSGDLQEKYFATKIDEN